jgi:hypothetical protein
MTYRNPRSTGSDSRVDASTTSVPGTTNPELRESFPMGQFQPSQKDQAIQVRGSKGQIPPVGILRIDYLAFCDRNNLWTVVFLHNLLLIARKARPFRDPFFVLYSFWLPFVLSLLKSGKEKQLSHTQRKGILTIYPYLYYLGGNRHTCHGGPSKEGMKQTMRKCRSVVYIATLWVSFSLNYTPFKISSHWRQLHQHFDPSILTAC